MFVLLTAEIEKLPYHGTRMCLHVSINVILFTKEKSVSVMTSFKWML